MLGNGVRTCYVMLSVVELHSCIYICAQASNPDSWFKESTHITRALYLSHGS